MVEIPALFLNLGLYQRPFVVTPSSIGCTGRVWKHARPPPSGIAGRHPDRTNALKYNRALDWNAAKHTASAQPFNSVSTRIGSERAVDTTRPRVIRRAYTAQSDTFRSEEMGIPPLRYAVSRDPTLALVVRCHPIARVAPNTDHAMRHIW